MKAVNDLRRRDGLTLLELVVVMAILVALGGLLVPLLGNYLHRANIASCAVNIPEMDKWIQTYVNLHAEYPDRMDNLCTPAGAYPKGPSGASYVLDGSTGELGKASFELLPLDAAGEEAAALKEAGIANLMHLVDAPSPTKDWNPTFWPYGDTRLTTPASTAITSVAKVATLTETGAQLMSLPWGGATNKYKYVIFGMNVPCTLFRNTVEEVPYHFADTPAEDPATYYMCFGAVFMVRDGDGNVPADGRAQYKGTIAFHDFGLSTAGMHTKEWWSRLKAERPNK